jgi:hypothetical protein
LNGSYWFYRLHVDNAFDNVTCPGRINVRLDIKDGATLLARKGHIEIIGVKVSFHETEEYDSRGQRVQNPIDTVK